jgi:uncharacterized protein (TIGR03083 family)
MDLLSAIADERRTLATLLEGFTPEQWAQTSLCDGWTNREVAAHLTMGLTVSTPKFMVLMFKARGDFNRAADTFARATAMQPTASIIKTIRDNADHKFKPPGAGHEAPLTDLLIHGLDIRRPLGIARTIPADRLRILLDTLAAPKSMKFFKANFASVKLAATDIDWSSGSGPVVSGTAEDLALLVSGRGQASGAMKNLTGEGVAIINQ